MAIQDKSWVSLEFDGKDLVEDFGIYVVSGGTRYSRMTHSNFVDETSQVPGRVGLQYWDTTIEDKQIDFNIATDRMSGRQLENFKRHFAANKIAKLVLSEAPYRYCFAKIMDSPRLDFIPFKQLKSINGKLFEDTLYKGEGLISLVLLNPLWYGNDAYFTEDITPVPHWVLESGLPIKDSLLSDTLLAKNIIYNKNLNTFIPNTTGITLTPTGINVYNAGSFEAYPQTSFQFIPIFSNLSELNARFIYPWNDKDRLEGRNSYNSIIFQDSNGFIFEFKYSLPSLLYTIQNAWIIAEKYANSLNTHREIMIAEMRDTLEHEFVRSQAMGYARATAAGHDVMWLKNRIADIIRPNTPTDIGLIRPITVNCDSENNRTTIFTAVTKCEFDSAMTLTTIPWEENGADMVIGQYISISGGNGLNDNGEITGTTLIKAIDYPLNAFKLNFKNTYI